MKLCMILLATLFPFLSRTRYEVEFQKMDDKKIEVVCENSELSLSLFNVEMKNEHGWEVVEQLVKEADHITMEIDPTTQVKQDLSVYLFLDGRLLQEELLERGIAYISIRNPNYTYEKQMEIAESKTRSVMGKENQDENKKGFPIVAPLYVVNMLILWIFLLKNIRNLYRKRMKKNM